MKITALTSLRTGKKIYVCVDKIVGVYEDAENHKTVVQMIGDYNCGFEVKETPSQVVEMMRKENMNLLTKEELQTIRIHMNAYREGLCNQGRYGESMYYDTIIDKLDEMLKTFDEVDE